MSTPGTPAHGTPKRPARRSATAAPAWMGREDVYTYMRNAYEHAGAPYGASDAGLARWVDEQDRERGGDAVARFEARKRHWNPYSNPDYAGPPVG